MKFLAIVLFSLSLSYAASAEESSRFIPDLSELSKLSLDERVKANLWELAQVNREIRGDENTLKFSFTHGDKHFSEMTAKELHDWLTPNEAMDFGQLEQRRSYLARQESLYKKSLEESRVRKAGLFGAKADEVANALYTKAIYLQNLRKDLVNVEERGYRAAATQLNDAIAKAEGDLVGLAHNFMKTKLPIRVRVVGAAKAGIVAAGVIAGSIAIDALADRSGANALELDGGDFEFKAKETKEMGEEGSSEQKEAIGLLD